MSSNTKTVEVIYLEKGSYKSRKFFSYPAGEAERVYRATLEKFKKEKTPALVMIRDGAGDGLIKSERV
jgi:hypothetical protein